MPVLLQFIDYKWAWKDLLMILLLEKASFSKKSETSEPVIKTSNCKIRLSTHVGF